MVSHWDGLPLKPAAFSFFSVGGGGENHSFFADLRVYLGLAPEN